LKNFFKKYDFGIKMTGKRSEKGGKRHKKTRLRYSPGRVDILLNQKGKIT